MSQPQGDPHAGGGEQADQGGIRSRPQRAPWSEPAGGQHEPADLSSGVDVRNAASLPVAEVVRRRQFMAGLFHAHLAGNLQTASDRGPSFREPWLGEWPKDRSLWRMVPVSVST